jgi:hypothetical protein
MSVFRSRASVLASVALVWQIFAVMLVPTAACCKPRSVSPASGDMANCPMQHSTQDAECPMHAPTAVDHDCHCPTLGCSQTTQGFMALLGPIGVLPAPASVFSLHHVGDAVPMTVSSSHSLAPVPDAPPPRA